MTCTVYDNGAAALNAGTSSCGYCKYCLVDIRTYTATKYSGQLHVVVDVNTAAFYNGIGQNPPLCRSQVPTETPGNYKTAFLLLPESLAQTLIFHQARPS